MSLKQIRHVPQQNWIPEHRRSVRRPASRGIWPQLTLQRARRSGPWVTASRVSSSSHEHLGGLTSSPRPPGAMTFQWACVPGHATPSPRGTPTPPRPPGHGAQLCSGSHRLLLQRQCRPPEHECPSQHGSAQQAPPSLSHSQAPGQSWGHPGVQGPRKHTVCFHSSL